MISWADALENIDILRNLCHAQPAQGVVPELIQQNFVLLQQSILPKIRKILETKQHEIPVFSTLLASFPTEPALTSTWATLFQASTTLFVAIQLVMPHAIEPIYREKIVSDLYTEENSIVVTVGKDLLQTIKQTDLPDKLQHLRQKLDAVYGFPFPQVTFRDDTTITAHKYTIQILDVEKSGLVLHNKILAINTQEQFPEIQGIECTDPVFGLPAKWISPILETQAKRQGLIVLQPLGVIIAHMERLLRQTYQTLLQRGNFGTLLQKTHDVASMYIALPKNVWLDIFQNCLRSPITLVDFPLMVNKILELQQTVPADMQENADYLFVLLRQLYPPQFMKSILEKGSVSVLQFTEQSGNFLINNIEIEEHNMYLNQNQVILQQIVEQYLLVRQHNPYLVCPDYIVPILLRLSERNGISIPLLMDSEIPEHIKRIPVGASIQLSGV